MQVYGCNISSLYEVKEDVDIFLIGVPKSSRKAIEVSFQECDIEINIPIEQLGEIKLLIYSNDSYDILDIEKNNQILLINSVLLEKGITLSKQTDIHLTYQFVRERVSVGKYGYYSIPLMLPHEECYKVYLKSKNCDILGKKLENIEYFAFIVAEENKRTLSTSLKRIVNGTRLEEKHILAILTNDEEIVKPFQVDFFKDARFTTSEFSIVYNQIDMNVEINVSGKEYIIPEDKFIDFIDLNIRKICSSINKGSLAEDIERYFL